MLHAGNVRASGITPRGSTAARPSMSDARTLTLRVELADGNDEGWRRLRLLDSLTLEHVHLALRAAMGWEEGGEYAFEALGQTYRGSDADDRELANRDSRHPSRFTLSDFGPRPGEAWDYRFDDGDLRTHRLTIEELDRPEDDAAVPPAVCLAAAGPHPADGGENAEQASAEVITRILEEWLGTTVAGPGSGPRPGAARREAHDETQPGTTVQVELEPEARDALVEVFRRLDEETSGGAELPPPVRSATEELLIIQAEFEPAALVRARKPETWAAGAIHAAHMELRRRRGAPEWTLRELAERFDVAEGSVSRRSREIRELAAEHHFWPGTVDGRFLDRLAAELEGSRTGGTGEGTAGDETGRPGGGEATDGSSGAPGSGPVGEIERLYLIGEESGRRSPFGRAAELLEEHAGDLDSETLEYLLQRGLENADGEAKRRMLHLAVRHFGTAVSTWAPEGARRWL